MTATARPTTPAAPAREYPFIKTPVPGPNARRVVEQDVTFASPCYIKEYPLVIARGERAMVEDVDGNRFLDFMAGIAVASTGYGHPKVIAAIKAQADEFLHICGSDFYFEGMANLFERLAKLAPGLSRKRVFLSNSGAEAVDGAIKLARNSTRRAGLIAFKGAFHGRTYGAMSLTSSKVKQHAGFGPMLSDVYHVPYANPYRCECGRAHADCHLHSIAAIEELFARQVDPRDVAAIFVEPIQGEGGYIVPPPQFLPALRALCDTHGILLVCDEIQCGVGRTGKMWATEFAGIEPDILLTAKGLASGMPLGAIIAKDSITKWENGAHGSTFGGNPVACAAAMATLDVVEQELLPKVPALGDRLIGAMRELQAKHPSIGDVRGKGLMIGVEFVKDRATREPAPELARALIDTAFEQGLLLLTCGKSTLRLAPPLVIDEQDIDIAVAIIDRALTSLT
jgi:4-aminobutyrate aminotransferase